MRRADRLLYKAKARLRQVSQSVVGARLETLRKQQQEEASIARRRVQEHVGPSGSISDQHVAARDHAPDGDTILDPDPLLRLNPEDKILISLEAEHFATRLVGFLRTCTLDDATDRRVAPRPTKGPETGLHRRPSWHLGKGLGPWGASYDTSQAYTRRGQLPHHECFVRT